MDLRPLGFGEIFDRAITIYVRNFLPFFAIVLMLIVPLAFLQYATSLGQSSQIEQMIQIVQHPNAKTPPDASMFGSPAQTLLVFAALAVFLLLWPFALNAVAVGVARLYRGRPVEFSACYKAALPRWPAILGMLALEVLAIIGWYFVLLIVSTISLVVSALLVQAWAPLGIAAFALAFFLILSMLVLLGPVFVSMAFGMNAVVIEGRGAVSAFGSGFGRIFNRKEFWRAVLFSICGIAITMIGSMLISVVAFAFLFLKWLAVEVVVTALLNAAFAPFSVVLIAVYYFDVRIRHEAFDLESELERLSAGPLVA